jgi:hypothetical protein
LTDKFSSWTAKLSEKDDEIAGCSAKEAHVVVGRNLVEEAELVVE